MSLTIELRPEAKAGWSELAAAESREYRADLAGRPRLHGFEFHISATPTTKAESLRTESTPEAVVLHKH